jgi:glycosyltransferase involved in cell wall biosynthesis
VDAAAGTDLDMVVHVHWLSVVTEAAPDEPEAGAAVKTYLERLVGMKDRGARIIWTIHDSLPVDARYPELECELGRGVVTLADRIHLMSPRTPELVAPWFAIPEDKAFLLPHPGYHGVYPAWMSREQARRELGIAPGATVFLLIGRVMAYKGLTELLTAFDTLTQQQPGRFVLLVAGRPDRDDETRRFREQVGTHPAVIAALHRIPDADMQVYLRAADVAVLPYRRSLNSGALALALTFGLPVILSAHTGGAAIIDRSYAEVYDADAPDGLLGALAASSRLASRQARAAAAAAGDRIALPSVACSFAKALRAWLDCTCPT